MRRTFSERMGYENPSEVIQYDSMDDKLRIALWNLIYQECFFQFLQNSTFHHVYYKENRLFLLIWTEFLNRPIDDIPYYTKKGVQQIRSWFFDCEWYKVYNLIEFLIVYGDIRYFVEDVNTLLEKLLSGYRVISKTIAPIISKEEINSIETALDHNINISQHLSDSLKLLSDKTKPDYRNSIKESISAVEALARLITGNQNVTLGSALSEIEKSGIIRIHKALKNSFSNLYGWTSNDEGIRHSLIDEPTLDQEDAIFMLVACSAFINYLIVKSQKAGIQIFGV